MRVSSDNTQGAELNLDVIGAHYRFKIPTNIIASDFCSVINPGSEPRVRVWGRTGFLVGPLEGTHPEWGLGWQRNVEIEQPL